MRAYLQFFGILIGAVLLIVLGGTGRMGIAVAVALTPDIVEVNA